MSYSLEEQFGENDVEKHCTHTHTHTHMHPYTDIYTYTYLFTHI